jgi:phosphatidylglycerophosphatase A
MEKSLFDVSLFLNSIEPLPNQIFSKDFDAYFFIEYPPCQYIKTDVYNPFPFLNNIDDETIFVRNPEGTHTLNYKIDKTTWDTEPYYVAFKQTFPIDRFLFWQSENDKWAMVSDDKHKIAIVGIDWHLADQVPLFNQNCQLSPAQVLKILNLEKHKDIFLRNYAPSANLTKGNDQNPLWIKYYFKCHVDTENDKLFYWKHFELLYHAIVKALSHFKSIDMYADQALERRYKMNKQIYSSGKNAPVGGWQKYSYDNCKKVATKFLTHNQHLQLKFEGKIDEAEALYMANKNGLIEFMNFWIYATLEKTTKKGYASDFYFLMGLYSFGNFETEFNQNFEFSYKKSTLNEDTVAVLLDELIALGFAKKVYKIEQPKVFAKYSPDKALQIEGIYGMVPDFDNKKSLIKETDDEV